MIQETVRMQAALYSLGLSCGVFEKNEIIIWCDKIIEYTLYGLDDAYDLAVSGVYSSVDEVELDLKNALGKYNSLLNEYKEIMTV